MKIRLAKKIMKQTLMLIIQVSIFHLTGKRSLRKLITSMVVLRSVKIRASVNTVTSSTIVSKRQLV